MDELPAEIARSQAGKEAPSPAKDGDLERIGIDRKEGDKKDTRLETVDRYKGIIEKAPSDFFLFKIAKGQENEA
jgi:hypothetical protein